MVGDHEAGKAGGKKAKQSGQHCKAQTHPALTLSEEKTAAGLFTPLASHLDLSKGSGGVAELFSQLTDL